MQNDGYSVDDYLTVLLLDEIQRIQTDSSDERVEKFTVYRNDNRTNRTRTTRLYVILRCTDRTQTLQYLTYKLYVPRDRDTLTINPSLVLLMILQRFNNNNNVIRTKPIITIHFNYVYART